MKRLTLTAAIFSCFFSCYSQQDQTVAIKDEFNTISKFTARQSGFEGIQTYSSGQVKGNQFLTSGWSPGSVTTTGNQTISNHYLFLFDKVRQELFLKEKDNTEVLLADKNEIKDFKINADKLYHFVPEKEYINNGKDFFQVLVQNNDKYTLLKKDKAIFVKADKMDMQRMKSGEFNDEFKDQSEYYISYKHGAPIQIKLREKKVLSAFTDKKDEESAKQYFKNNTNPIDEDYLVNLIISVNDK